MDEISKQEKQIEILDNLKPLMLALHGCFPPEYTPGQVSSILQLFMQIYY